MTAIARSLIAEELGLSASAVHVAPRARLPHQNNNLYDAWAGERHMVVKEYIKPEESEHAPMREAGALRLLAPLDIAPRLVLCHTTPTNGFGPFIVYDWMEGEMWDRRRPSPRELRSLADLWLTQHALSTDNLWISRRYEGTLRELGEQFLGRFRKYAEWTEVHYPAARPAVGLSLQALERQRHIGAELDHLVPVLCFCRGDARFANVIARPDGRPGLVDWEDSGLRDPARDLADLLTHANQEDLLAWDEWQVFVRPYLDGRAASDPELERRMDLYLAVYPIYRLVILLGYGLQRAREGQLAGWEINDMPANQRLRRYLARALAWPSRNFTRELDALDGLTFVPERENPFSP